MDPNNLRVKQFKNVASDGKKDVSVSILKMLTWMYLVHYFTFLFGLLNSRSVLYCLYLL